MAVFREEKITSAEGYVLTARVYEARDPRAVIRIIHGMEEYQDRYEPFAAWMQERGYTVLTADLRGHGPNAPILSHIADADGDRLLIEDERVLLRKRKDQAMALRKSDRLRSCSPAISTW